MAILSLNSVSYAYNGGAYVLKDLSYTFEKGKIYAIVGKSGAGKTTLLSLLSALTAPTQGQILYDGKDVRSIDQYRYRSRCVGVVFQSFNLLPNLTARENVVLSMEISGKKFENKTARALELLEKVELDESRADRRVLKLSGGEQQRVAIARALAYDPDILLADEPTGNLDEETQESIIEIFRRLADEEGKCIIMVTHSPAVAMAADQVYRLERLSQSGKGVRKKPAARSARSAPVPPAPAGGSTLGLD